MKENLEVVNKSKELVHLVYRISKKLPKEERYIIIPQMLRSVISIPSNLIEGHQRTDKEFINFIRIAKGSLYELKLQLEIIEKEYNIDMEKAFQIMDNIGGMIYGLNKSLYTKFS